VGKLTDSNIKSKLGEIPGWTFEDNSLRRLYTCRSFPDAVTMVVRLAFAAEAADHHPDVLLNYKKVIVTWSTHSEGGVTEKDFAGARQSDTISRGFV